MCYAVKYLAENLRGVRILDCSLRDGGLCCDSMFPEAFPESLIGALSACGADIVEVGFKSAEGKFSPAKFGPLRFCREEYLRVHFSKLKGRLKFAAMIDVLTSGMSGLIVPKSESVVDILRVCAYYDNLCEMKDILAEAKEKGYETAACLMAVSTLSDSQIDCALGEICSSAADIVYLMDSFGALLPQRASSLAERYAAAAHSSGRLAGAHFHDNMQLAFANSIAAACCGVDIIDSSVGGMGKGAGNCRTEEILPAKFSLKEVRILMEFIERRLIPMKGKYSWGYRQEYALSAVGNMNSKIATAFIKGNACQTPRPLDFLDGLPPAVFSPCSEEGKVSRIKYSSA